jgi:hypothetical protein
VTDKAIDDGLICYINFFSIKIVVTKKVKVKTDTAASSGGQGKLRYFMYFS